MASKKLKVLDNLYLEMYISFLSDSMNEIIMRVFSR